MLEKYELMTWNDFDSACRLLTLLVKSHEKIVNKIYGIPRGGLVPAVKLSHLLKIPMIYEENKIDENTLVINDIFDTGKTISSLKCRLNLKHKCMFASLYSNENAIGTIDIYIKEKTDYWIVFPWERI
jgi:uncharacterized protein